MNLALILIPIPWKFNYYVLPMKSSTINGLLTLTGVLENTWDISALSVLLCICSIWAAIYRRSVYSGFNSRVSHTITSWMIFQFNQIASPLWPVSGKIEDNEWMIGSSPLANVAYTLRMHDVIVWFFFFLPLPLGKWNKLLRLVESGLPWGFHIQQYTQLRYSNSSLNAPHAHWLQN